MDGVLPIVAASAFGQARDPVLLRVDSITRHFVGAFHGVPGARAFRRYLAENGVRPGAGVSVLRDAIALVDDRAVASIAA